MERRRGTISISAAIVIAVVTAWRLQRRHPPAPPIVAPPPVVKIPVDTIHAAPRPSEATMPDELPPPGPTAVTATIKEKVEFRWAIVVPGEQGLDVRLLSEPAETCTHHAKEQYRYVDTPPARGHRLRFVLPAGPGGTYFAGQPVGVALSDTAKALRDPVVYGGVEVFFVSFDPAHSIVKVEPFELRKGARLKGTIVFDADTISTGIVHGQGTFDAEICDVPAPGTELPATAPSTPAAGQIGELAWEARSATLSVSRKGTYPSVISLRLSPTPNLDCKDFDKFDSDKNDVLYFDNIGGAARDKPLLRTPQLADMWLSSARKELIFFEARRHAWVRFDSLTFEAGKKVTGTLQAASWPPHPLVEGHIGGRFEAVVCP